VESDPCKNRKRGAPGLLLCRDQIELTGRFFIEKRSLFGIAPAPMLLSTGNSQETAWPHTLVAGFILVQIGALHNNYPNIVSVGVHPGIVSRRELGECGMRSFIRIAQIPAMETPLVVSWKFA
jgi:hypothetical protein